MVCRRVRGRETKFDKFTRTGETGEVNQARRRRRSQRLQAVVDAHGGQIRASNAPRRQDPTSGNASAPKRATGRGARLLLAGGQPMKRLKLGICQSVVVVIEDRP
jgi:hypothetical protein